MSLKHSKHQGPLILSSLSSLSSVVYPLSHLLVCCLWYVRCLEPVHPGTRGVHTEDRTRTPDSIDKSPLHPSINWPVFWIRISPGASLTLSLSYVPIELENSSIGLADIKPEIPVPRSSTLSIKSSLHTNHNDNSECMDSVGKCGLNPTRQASGIGHW